MAKVYELLILHRKLFANMARHGITSEDIMYIELFKEYKAMEATGAKQGDICKALAGKYKVPASAVKRVVKRLDEDIWI